MKSSKELMGEISHDSAVINKNKVEGEEAPLAFTTKKFVIEFSKWRRTCFSDIDVKPGERSC